RAGRARHVGAERAADHRTRATRVLPPRPSDHVAAVAADSRARLGGTLEVGDPAAHENGIAPPHGDVGNVPSRGKTPFIPAPAFAGVNSSGNPRLRVPGERSETWDPETQSAALGPRFRGDERKSTGHLTYNPQSAEGLGAARAMRYHLGQRTIRTNDTTMVATSPARGRLGMRR